MTLKDLVQRYRELAAEPGKPVPLESFGLPEGETEKVFGDLDEDYHISRHLHFTRGAGRSYRISGEEVTHVAIDEGMSKLL